MHAMPLGRSQHMARGLLHDFAASGVDEDLEMLKSQWKKPPPQPAGFSDDDDDDEDDVQDDWPGRSNQRQPWRGGPPKSKKTDQLQRVRSGALDFRSEERLASLNLLRNMASTPADQLDIGQYPTEPMALMMLNAGASASSNYRSGRNATDRSVSDIERAARSRRSSHEPGLDWSSWEDRWAEQLKGLAGAAARAKRDAEERRRHASHTSSSSSSSSAAYGDEYESYSEETPLPRTRSSSSQSSSYSQRTSYSQRAQQQQQQQQRKRREEQERQKTNDEWQQQQQQQQWQRQQQQRPPPRRSAPPPKAPPPPASSRPTASAAPKARGRFFDSWTAFDQAFTTWEAESAGHETLSLETIPFPPAHDPAGLSEAGLLRGVSGEGGEQNRKKLLRKALLRWHPDKWMSNASKIRAEELSELTERLSAITQALVEQKDLA